MTVLSGAEWRAAATAHRERAAAELADVIHRRDRAVKHPIDDFLFHYYNLRPSYLMAWYPGAGVTLADAVDFPLGAFHRRDGDEVRLDVETFLAKRGATAETALTLLEATAGATPRFGCFGMHEWAMVYRLAPGETRHPYLQLRFPPERVAEIVEDVGCRCSHFDAFRFFTPDAVPLNTMEPTRQTQVLLDQPGCLHVNMDLYRWAGKLSPAVPSDLLFETFLLARDIRVMDMAASAYDLADWGVEPVRVETAEGRSEYARRQREFAERAAPLRARLIGVLEPLLRDPARTGHSREDSVQPAG